MVHRSDIVLYNGYPVTFEMKYIQLANRAVLVYLRVECYLYICVMCCSMLFNAGFAFIILPFIALQQHFAHTFNGFWVGFCVNNFPAHIGRA
jgi:hypothetical protein